ncbi:MAG: hypothetical protein JRJ31_16860 [Deltaproteobacteria bacterium]|nr:hypothetical protein [Deltaproteobacteria bacterium]
MRASNATYDTNAAYDYQRVVYLIHFDGESTDYVNRKIGSPTNTLKQYLMKLTGLSQSVVPEEGRASIGNVVATIADVDDEITALLATDSYYFHRRKTTVKVGYVGMNESDMLIIMTGWVTGLKMTKDLDAWEFTITDPQRWMQRKIFRGAEDTSVSIQGNPLNLLLALLTSTGNGTNGDYDWYESSVGLGMSTDYIDVTDIESVRDNWFPGDSNYMKFTITKREVALKWFQREIFKPLNIYPAITGEGKFTVKPLKPPIPAIQTVQSFSDSDMIGLPSYDMNLDAMINEVEFFYDHDGDDYQTQKFDVDGTSLNNRGPGSKVLQIKSKGYHSSDPHTTDAVSNRIAHVLERWSTPPLAVSFKTTFDKWLSEPGDVVPITHSMLPDVEAGTKGLSDYYMEIINRSVDWHNNLVTMKLLGTGFDRGSYGAISPIMIITSGSSGTSWSVSVADAAKYEEGWEVNIYDSAMRKKATRNATSWMGGFFCGL